MIPAPATLPQVELIETAHRTTNRLSPITAPRFASPAKSGLPSLTLDPSRRFQKLVGFGGAITESSAYNLGRIPESKAREILERYYHPEKGIGYTVTRTHINSCDFSLGNWACVETPGDTELKSFQLDRTRKYILRSLLQAQSILGKPLVMVASPWSPPAWMKTNSEMNNGGSLKPEYRKAWALYYVRFIQEMENQGIQIWGITVQNEPAAVQRWDSCIYSAEEERDFVRDYLGPALEQGKLQHIKIIVWDHNKDILYDRVAPILQDAKAAAYVWGIGLHWYGGAHPEEMDRVSREFPGKAFLSTEACWEGGVKLGQWDRGQRYAHHMLIDLNHGAVGWIDWNIVLDENGGPNHVGNHCDAPVIVDTRTGEVHYQSSFYYIGHFSRYLKSNAERIGLDDSGTGLESTAFSNPDGSIAVVVHNPGSEALTFALRLDTLEASCSIPAEAIQTYILHPGKS